MNNGNLCVSVYAATADELCERIRRAEPLADIIELRFDHLRRDEIERTFETLPHIETPYLITFRPASQGGPRDFEFSERKSFWARIPERLAGRNYFVDIEDDLDLPSGVDPSKVIVSSHSYAASGFDADAEFAKLKDSQAGILKIASQADVITDAIGTWRLLENAENPHRKVTPIAMGEAGKWTRILGLAHGAFMTYASIETGSETAPGQISAEDLRNIYRVKEVSRETDVYGIIAGDTSYSMSPHIHNPAFASTGADAVFIPLQVAALDEFMRRMVLAGSREVELNFKGFSVTNPHKQAIRKFLSWTHPDAAAIGAINTVKIVGEELHGYNTDAGGFIKPLLREFGDLNGSRAAVIGTGGAARACIYVLKTHGCDVTVFGRDGAKVETLAREFGARHASLSGSTFGDFDIVVNATPVGTKGPKQHETVATANELLGARVVYDLTYNPVDTVLAAEARSAGATFIGGLEMLINQGAEQFKIWTGLDGPLDVMRSAARKRLGL